MAIQELGCVIKSLASNEFILHFPNTFDLRATCDSADRREDFLNIVKLRYAHLQPKYTLKVYGVVSNFNVLKTFVAYWRS